MASKESGMVDKRRGTFVASYRHYKTGKVIRAKDYGLKAFHFPPRTSQKDPPVRPPMRIVLQEDGNTGQVDQKKDF